MDFFRMGRGILALLVVFGPGFVPALHAGVPGHELRLYGGQVSDNEYDEIVLGETELEDSYLLAAAWTGVLGRPHRWFRVEGEINLAGHFGLQDHGEANALVSLRLTRFPWDSLLDTSLAMGLGPSYAFETPPLEAAYGDGERLLAFWLTEITVDPYPNSPWNGLVRIHHRSSVFGLVSDAYGSNFITVGVGYRL